MTFDPTIISNIILIATAVAASFLVLLWLSLIVWTYRDISLRTREPLAKFLAVLVVAILSLLGVLIYLLLRPRHTVEEEYDQTLEEEALLRSIEDAALCPGCGRHVREDWIVCPSCRTELSKPCLRCKHIIQLSWSVCPYCGTQNPDNLPESVDNSDPSTVEK